MDNTCSKCLCECHCEVDECPTCPNDNHSDQNRLLGICTECACSDEVWAEIAERHS